VPLDTVLMDSAPPPRTKATVSRPAPLTQRFHVARPAVYLDQWVSIRLAKANLGRPDRPEDLDLLNAVLSAAGHGVAFPSSATYYFETLAITDPRQRQDLAAVMAPVSRFLNIAPLSTLIRQQLLNAFHEIFGRPAFRPAPPKILRRGVHWAMLGAEVPMQILDDGGVVTEARLPGVSRQVRAINQVAQTMLISGPADDEIARLRSMGYQPEKAEESTRSRLTWEQDFARQLATSMPLRNELRVWLMTRELIHEHMTVFNELLTAYRINLHARSMGIRMCPAACAPR
jgi:hypothetical protein